MAVINPSRYVVMAWHQNRTAHISADQDVRSENWWRPEFFEPSRAQEAREALESWLLDCPAALRHAMYLLHVHARPPGRPAGPFDLHKSREEQAIHSIAHWLDDALYGTGKAAFHPEERYAIQVTADSMARGDFCRMDFRAVVAEVIKTEVDPVPLT